MKKILEASLIVRLLTAAANWIDRQWERSFLAALVTGGRDEAGESLLGRVPRLVHRALCAVFRALRLDRLLEGSVFRRSWFWMALAVFAAPLAPTMAVLGLAVIAMGSLTLNYGCDPERRVPRAPEVKWVAVFAAVYLISTLLSVDLRGSLLGGLLTCAFTVFAILVMDVCRDRSSAERLLYVMAISGVLVALYGIAQAALGLESTEAWVDQENFEGLTLRVYSTLDNPNVLSEYLMLVTPLAAALTVNARTANGRITWGLGTLAMLLCLALTYARGGYLGIAFAAAIFLVLLDRRFIPLGVLGLAVLLMLLPQSIMTRLLSIGDLSDSSTSYRVYIWLATLNLLRDYWLCGFGTGVSAFQSVYPRYSFNAVSAPHAHNLFLEIFCECGILGLTALLGAILSFVRDLARAFRGAARRDQVLLAAMLASMGGFMVQSMTDHSFYNYRVTLMFWVLVGLGGALARAARSGEADK